MSFPSANDLPHTLALALFPENLENGQSSCKTRTLGILNLDRHSSAA
jgi:hypothetical protein